MTALLHIRRGSSNRCSDRRNLNRRARPPLQNPPQCSDLLKGMAQRRRADPENVGGPRSRPCLYQTAKSPSGLHGPGCLASGKVYSSGLLQCYPQRNRETDEIVSLWFSTAYFASNGGIVDNCLAYSQRDRLGCEREARERPESRA